MSPSLAQPDERAFLRQPSSDRCVQFIVITGLDELQSRQDIAQKIVSIR